MSFTDTDHFPDVFRRLRGADLTAVAGIFSPEKAEEAEKLTYQEFGTKVRSESAFQKDATEATGAVRVPQRQTVAPAFDEGEDEIVEDIADGLYDVIRGAWYGDKLAERTAETLADNIRARIESNTPPPLAESTLAARRRRGNNSTQTLVDEGDMLKAIEHTVVRGEFNADG